MNLSHACLLVYFHLDTVCFAKSKYSVVERNRVQIDVTANKPALSTIIVRLNYESTFTATSK